ncbi:histone-fold-containing protein [Trematosphaeria pertusa]|uniref:Histone H4 n=1 Tax=Trematosphaeria pertusa TaxID=390896 RepID=A0A6A6IGR0_9PLEO|nr:histone-fold-containing protein [Trematosphaeria pertusa]KAF2248740.1 histone-fold-containing protein [Trematosphaeria pertusa]
MVKERNQFVGVPRFQGSQRPGTALSTTLSASPLASRASQLGLGLGKGGMGLGKGKAMKRHKKVHRDTIQGVTKGDIRRLARRGGVKRISATIYDDVRFELKARLELLLKNIIALVEHSGRKTVVVTDVIFTLNRLGRPLYGFDPSFDGRHR